MKKISLIAASAMLFLANSTISAQENESDKQLTFMLYGASFAIPQNGWFEIACENMGAEALNKAVSAEAIYHDARRMAAGKDYTTAELDRTDVLVIMHVHNQNVANEANLQEKWEDYTNISTTTDYAVAYDYVIKRYIADCEALEFNEESKYYGVEGGKPAKIMLCTHWHDSRTTYNPAIRKLAERWGFPLVEFDKNIGFSKDDEGIADAGEPSRAVAHDTETINGIKYGWHPKRGNNSPIQNRMAAIFTQTVADAYGYHFPFETRILPMSEVVLPGEDANFTVSFHNGMFPYSISGAHTASGLEGKKHVLTVPGVTENTSLSVNATHAAWGEGNPAEAEATANVLVASYCATPDYDSYVNRLNTSSNYDTSDVLQLKYADNATRKAYVSFQASELMPRDVDKVVLRLFYKDYILGYFNSESSRPMEGIEHIRVEGNTNVYKGSKINWSTSGNHVFEPIDAKAEICTDMVGAWVSIDVTDWALNTLAALEEKHKNQNTGHLTFRLYIEKNNWCALMNFYSTEGAPVQARSLDMQPAGPQLLFAKNSSPTGVEDVKTSASISVAKGQIFNPGRETVAIYTVDGLCKYTGTEENISLEAMPHGLYLIQTPSSVVKYLR